MPTKKSSPGPGSAVARWLSWLMVLLIATPLLAQEVPSQVLEGYRGQLGLSVPRFEPWLAQACQTRAEALLSSGELSHGDERGRGPGVQMVGQGLPPGEYGEVLGAGPSLTLVWNAWVHSPSHRSILEDPHWMTWGWGRARSDGVEVWVVRFWRP